MLSKPSCKSGLELLAKVLSPVLTESRSEKNYIPTRLGDRGKSLSTHVLFPRTFARGKVGNFGLVIILLDEKSTRSVLKVNCSMSQSVNRVQEMQKKTVHTLQLWKEWYSVREGRIMGELGTACFIQLGVSTPAHTSLSRRSN